MTHWIAPVVPLVEAVCGPRTSEEILASSTATGINMGIKIAGNAEREKGYHHSAFSEMRKLYRQPRRRLGTMEACRVRPKEKVCR